MHSLIILTVVFGVLLPKMSAVVVSMLPGVQTIVICTGNEMQAITINADGEPIEVKDLAMPHCTLSDLPKSAGISDPSWVALQFAYGFEFVQILSNLGTDLRSRPDPTRAPPVAV